MKQRESSETLWANRKIGNQRYADVRCELSGFEVEILLFLWDDRTQRDSPLGFVLKKEEGREMEEEK